MIQEKGELEPDDGEIMFKRLLEDNFSSCLKKPEADRTFFRKDHLIQHIKRCHLKDRKQNDDIPAHIGDHWEQEGIKSLAMLWEQDMAGSNAGHSVLHCSICAMDFDSWTSRKKHFHSHFTNGVFVCTTQHVAESQGW